VLKGGSGERVVPADGFFLGGYATLLEPSEIMTEIRVPIPAPGTGWAYAKLKRKVGDFATAATAVTLRLKGETVQEVAIALTNVGASVLRASAAEASLRGKALDDAAIAEAARLAMSICDPAADQRGDADYKTAMAGEMTQRALRSAYARATP
jgi:carbon-monoxide dehydrogenase medium subunit